MIKNLNRFIVFTVLFSLFSVSAYAATLEQDIINLTNETQIIKFKKINYSKIYPHEDEIEISYIVQFSHKSYNSDFDVDVLILDDDGFEITHRKIGRCAGTNFTPLTYNLKGTFWIPLGIYLRMKKAELTFSKSAE